MKKLFALFGLVIAFAMLPAVAMAAPPPAAQAVQHASSWSVVGKYVISFNCATCVPHNITISSSNRSSGAFSGFGAYAANPAYTWAVSGIVTGNQITMRILYTGLNAGYYVDLTGTIAPNGTMSGNATQSSGGQFTWMTTSGHATSCNKDRDESDRDKDDKRMLTRPNLRTSNRR
jgi:hypothetical protein